ncbi:hypothetical protein JAAARDRAFT_70493 [Jaapia argillacea MUCL 33604]|uniref:Dipeptidyl-peptidase V n=1 Tax=Jaapia argillacea MUCL 33604 TaxID=933084 RepID=A0A067PSL5_9AGAM|nr:hypothetical protein JAAARDRAFT_70493 [Jaapia argillacea MUCL 33604]
MIDWRHLCRGLVLLALNGSTISKPSTGIQFPFFISSPPPLTPQAIATAENILAPHLSGDGAYVVYEVKPKYRVGDHPVSALWIAETGLARSARRLTSGDYDDHSAIFHPNGSTLFFLSDRHESGAAQQIYRLDPFGHSQDAFAITSISNKKPVQSFSMSPDGRYIAFVSADETPAVNEETLAGKHDSKVWNGQVDLGRLRILETANLQNGIRTLVSCDRHVDSVSWSPDSKSIIYRMKYNANLESNAFPTSEEIVSISSTVSPRTIINHSRNPQSPSIWVDEDIIYHLRSTTLDVLASSPSVWSLNISTKVPPHRVYLGDSEDAGGLVNVGVAGQVAVEVVTGVDTRIDILDRTGKLFTLYQTIDDGILAQEWDVKLLPDGTYVFVAFKSSAVAGEPVELWSGRVSGQMTVQLSQKLSHHNAKLQAFHLPKAQPVFWTSKDGVDLAGVIAYPANQPFKNLPTVVIPHGGPYHRDALDLQFSCQGWRTFLASHGYLVLSPNYRGSSGRGNEFARTSHGGVGRLDWLDTQGMLEEAIARGIADPNRLAIAGWSQGGFLTAWGVTRPNSTFKAGIVGAGPTDWGSMALQSDLPDFQADLGGNAPWSGTKPQYMTGSPIHFVKNVEAPLLIVHGEADVRVPVTQAIGFMRGIIRETEGSDRSRLVIFPREGHGFVERAHAEDLLEMVLEHIDQALN